MGPSMQTIYPNTFRLYSTASTSQLEFIRHIEAVCHHNYKYTVFKPGLVESFVSCGVLPRTLQGQREESAHQGSTPRPFTLSGTPKFRWGKPKLPEVNSIFRLGL